MGEARQLAERYYESFGAGDFEAAIPLDSMAADSPPTGRRYLAPEECRTRVLS